MGNNSDPFWDDGVCGWIVETARKNFWRVAGWYEFEDLVQDGYLNYAKCRARFKPRNALEPTPDDRREFMFYFMKSFTNHITDLANRRSATPEVPVAALTDGQAETVEDWTQNAADLGDLATLIAQAPTEIAELLRLILVDGLAEVPYLKTRLRKKEVPGSKVARVVRGRAAIRETTEHHYDRCLGKAGVVEQLRSYFLKPAADV